MRWCLITGEIVECERISSTTITLWQYWREKTLALIDNENLCSVSCSTLLCAARGVSVCANILCSFFQLYEFAPVLLFPARSLSLAYMQLWNSFRYALHVIKSMRAAVCACKIHFVRRPHRTQQAHMLLLLVLVLIVVLTSAADTLLC